MKFDVAEFEWDANNVDNQSDGEGPPCASEWATAPRAYQPNFIQAKTFEGTKNGMVFQTGLRGTGYYRDGPPKIDIALVAFPLEMIPPLVLNLNLLTENFEEPPTKETTASGQIFGRGTWQRFVRPRD